MEDTSRLDEAVKAIAKQKGGKLDLLDVIPSITAVEGDNIDTWHLCVNKPFRGMQYGKELDERDILKQLRQVKTRYKQMLSQVEREIAWILGEENVSK